MPRLTQALIGPLAALFLAAGFAAHAQETAVEGSVKFNLLSIEGLVIGKTLRVDDDYGAEHGIEVPRPFSILVPTADDVLELADFAPEGPGGPYVKINFATEDRQLIENIQFVGMVIPMDAPETRMEKLAGLMANNVFDSVTGNSPRRVRDLVRQVEISGLPAVEVIGRYEEPELGLMFLRIVGIPDPDGPHGVFSVANVVAARQELPAPDDFPRTRGGATLRHFEFLNE